MVRTGDCQYESEGLGSERLAYHRHRGLPGVEILNVQHTQRRWMPCPEEYSFFVPSSWEGMIRYGARDLEMHGEKVLCTAPHQGIEVSEGAGAFQVLTIDSDVLVELLSPTGRGKAVLTLCPDPARPSKRLTQSLATMARALMTPSQSTPSLRRHASDLIELMAVELFEVRYAPDQNPYEADIGERLERELRLMRTSDVVPTLQACAQRYGLSRYQLYRIFRQRQAISPKRYALGAAIAQAKRALAHGHSPAEAAIVAGFFDQSHLTRHFKQTTGVTPAEYVRSIGAPRSQG